MIFRYPDYYEKFSCIAGACEDNAVLAGKLILMTKVMNIIKQ